MSLPAVDFEPSQLLANNKRKANELQPETTVKRRAARACLSCRSRKVRCDATNRGTPCTNCRLDNVCCLLTDPQRNRSCITASTNMVEENMSSSEGAAGLPMALTFEGNLTTPDPIVYKSMRSSRVSRAVEPSPPRENPRISPTTSISSPSVSPTGTSTLSAKQQAQGLPCYVRPLSAHLKPEDLEYLRKKGALILPDDDLQLELLRKYIQYVWVFMPTLDLSTFILPISRRNGEAPVSLLLLQAVMFASVAFVDPEYLVTRGHDSRRSARKIFFERARLLYDLDCETDSTAVLQALLLMSYWFEKPEDERETWYWTGLALSQAQVLGIHRNPDYLNISAAMKRLRKRLWWSCYIRDRLLAIGVRRLARIRSDDFSVPMLTLDDFEMEPLKDDVLEYLGPLPTIDNASAKRTMSIACVQLAQLCVHIGDILFTQYSTLGNPAYCSEDNMTMMVMPKNSLDQMNRLAKCDLKLRSWLQNLDPACRYAVGHQPVAGEPERQQDGSTSVNLAMLHLIFFTASTILHRDRPQALPSSTAAVDNGVESPLSSSRVSDAALGITEIVYELYSTDKLRYASTSIIPALLSATMIHLIKLRTRENESRFTSIGRFYQCWQALQQLREIYASADHAIWFLEAAIQKTKIHIPMFNIGPLPGNPKLSPKSRECRSSIRFSSHSVNQSRFESAAHPVETTVTQTAFLNIGTASADTTNADNSGSAFDRSGQGPMMTLRSTMGGSFADLDMRDTITIGPDDATYTEFGAGDGLLQDLVQFDADPGFFIAASAGL